MRPIQRRFATFFTILLLAIAVGCSGPMLRSRSQSPERAEGEEGELEVKLVSEYAVPIGTNYIRLEGPVLITNLKGTGSDPPPGPQRTALLADMQARKVQKPNQLLADPNNSLAWAQTWLPPGVQKRDRIDVEVRVPPQNDTTSIAGGYMMETRLKEMAVMGGQIHDGHVMAIAQGALLVDPVLTDNKDPMALKRGIVLNGGVSLKTRPLGLALLPEQKSVYRSKQIGDALNRRFHVYHRGIKQGIATPHTDEWIELTIHPRYKQNLARYFHVIRAVPMGETPSQQQQRLELLERQLNDPITCQKAAIKLEAIGKDAIRVLEKGIQSNDPEVRFYSAEALAYLDQPAAASVLAEAAKKEPAFRAYALAALCALNDAHAADSLRELFDVPSAETRYGAFRALWAMNENDPQLNGEHLGKKFWLHVIPSSGPAMVHVTHSSRPEVVLFGEGQEFEMPVALEAGNSIVVKTQSDGQIRISRFVVSEPDRNATVNNSVDEVIRAIAEVGGDYPDVVHALQQARMNGALTSRFEVDAIPQRNRVYDRNRKLAKADSKSGETVENDGLKADDVSDTSNEKPSIVDQLPSLFGGSPKVDDGSRRSVGSDEQANDEDDKTAEGALKNLEKSASRRKRFGVE